MSVTGDGIAGVVRMLEVPGDLKKRGNDGVSKVGLFGHKTSIRLGG